MSTQNRNVLEPYAGQRVAVKGYYSTSRTLYLAYKTVSCVEDCEVTTPDGRTHFFHHLWVQRANSIANLRPLRGSRLTFSAVVTSYTRTGPRRNAEEIAWSVTHPEDVEVTATVETDLCTPLPLARPSPAPAPASPPAFVSVLRSIRELTGRVDPEAMRQVLPHLADVAAVVKECGGPDTFLDLLEFAEK